MFGRRFRGFLQCGGTLKCCGGVRKGLLCSCLTLGQFLSDCGLRRVTLARRVAFTCIGATRRLSRSAERRHRYGVERFTGFLGDRNCRGVCVRCSYAMGVPESCVPCIFSGTRVGEVFSIVSSERDTCSHCSSQLFCRALVELLCYAKLELKRTLRLGVDSVSFASGVVVIGDKGKGMSELIPFGTSLDG